MKSMKYLARSASMLPLGIAALAVAGSLLAPDAAWAVTPDTEVCMQRAFMGPGATLTNANSLNCSANDIRIARAISAKDADGNDITSCTRGQPIDLKAEFEVIVTANARYDTAFFFRKDGDGNARGDGTEKAGACRVEGLDVPPGLSLDGDGVGDLNSGSYIVEVEFRGVECAANASGPGAGKLLLPNCTSWHSNASTVANDTDVYTWDPETKSKCRCDDAFFLNIDVEEPAITVVKTVSPAMVAEDTGGKAFFTVKVTNDNQTESVDIGSMMDYRWQPGNDPASGTPTLADVFSMPAGFTDDEDSLDFCWELTAEQRRLGPGEYLTCKFDDSVNGGQAGQKYVNTVKVVGHQVGTGTEVKGEDTANVTLRDIPSVPALTKKVQRVMSCHVAVQYQVVVTNNSTSDGITVESLNDDLFGVITEKQGQVAEPCDTSTWGEIPAGGDSRSCTFTAVIEETDCDFTHVNRVTAGGKDDDSVPFSIFGDATVEVDQLKPAP